MALAVLSRLRGPDRGRPPGGLKGSGLAAALALTGAVAYAANFKMSADRIFLAPASVALGPAAQNTVEHARLVVGIDAQ